MHIGTIIKNLRHKKGLTQEELAAKLGLTSRAVSQWECEKTEPDISLIGPLCNLFDITSDELLGIDITLVLMDESFSGTSQSEASAIAFYTLQRFCHRGVVCFFSTHIHDLTLHLDELNNNEEIVFPAYVETKNDGTRTFRVVYGKSDDLSHAVDIAKRVGLYVEE